MISRLRKCLGLPVAVILSLAFSPLTRAAEQVDVHFHFRNSAITLHEPVILMFTVHNGTAQEASFDLGIDKRQFLHLSLTLPHGTRLESEPLYPEGFHASGKVVIPPGGDYEQLLVLNQWFRFDSVGEYFLAAQLDTTIAVTAANSSMCGNSSKIAGSLVWNEWAMRMPSTFWCLHSLQNMERRLTWPRRP